MQALRSVASAASGVVGELAEALNDVVEEPLDEPADAAPHEALTALDERTRERDSYRAQLAELRDTVELLRTQETAYKEMLRADAPAPEPAAPQREAELRGAVERAERAEAAAARLQARLDERAAAEESGDGGGAAGCPGCAAALARAADERSAGEAAAGEAARLRDALAGVARAVELPADADAAAVLAAVEARAGAGAARLQAELRTAEKHVSSLQAGHRQAQASARRALEREEELVAANAKLECERDQLAVVVEQLRGRANGSTALQAELDAARRELESRGAAAAAEARAELAALREQVREQAAAAQRALDAEAAAASLRADLALRDRDVERLQTAAGNLERVLAHRAEETAALAAEHAAALEAAVAAERRAGEAREALVEDRRRALAEEHRLALAARAAEHAAALEAAAAATARAREEAAGTRASLDEAIARINAAGADEMVDRRIVSDLIVTYKERPTDEVLQLMAAMLGFSDEQKRRVGLLSGGPGGGLLSTLWHGPATPSAAADNDDATLSQQFLHFLMEQSKEDG